MASVGVFLVSLLTMSTAFSLTHVVRARRSCWISGRRPFARPVFLIVALVTATIARRTPLCDCAPRPAPEYCAVRCAEEINALHAERPSAVGFSPHGMPSNHSQFVFFFAAFWCSYLLRNNNNNRAARINERVRICRPPLPRLSACCCCGDSLLCNACICWQSILGTHARAGHCRGVSRVNGRPNMVRNHMALHRAYSFSTS